MAITFEQLPDAIAGLYDRLEVIERLLSQKKEATPDQDQFFTIKEAAAFITLSPARIYTLVSRSAIPCMKKGQRLYFSRNELTEWIKTGRKKTLQEIDQETDISLSK